MRARVDVHLVGSPDVAIGEIVEGADAVRLCAAGLATPVVEKPVVETATKKRVTKETRGTE